MNLEQSNPLVTVYIPTYNRVELLKRAVESVRQQTYKNLEIIIVDDCSKDGTHEYLDEISKQDLRIKYFIKEKNSGACVSRNIAIENAKGEFITGLDDDDYFTLDRIEIFIKSWDSHNPVLVGLCAPILNNKIGKNRLLSKISYILGVKTIKKRDMYFANYVGNQIFTKTELLRQIGGFDQSFRAWQDFDTWFRLLDLGFIQKLEKPTYFVDRSHEMGRITTQNVNKILTVQQQFIEKHKVKNKIYIKALNNHLYTYDHTKVLFTDVLVRVIFQYSDIKYNLIYVYDFFRKKLKTN
ncbi:glycosyltransferase family 2 protein [Acinetobacter schindleri]|uniref:glycosyltransferase family 2 protein n=1 Tax=Acinetobacter schindleri TaxID=108981 RepID=UPI002DBA7570|nr:glycosyltransferase [Acinetobacter schindleri]MEB5928257.1 glycosyltransferase [Acinetobacter schindleri]